MINVVARWLGSTGVFVLALSVVSGRAAAQAAAPAPQPAPPVWGPAGYEPPPVLPYREGQPVPPGYHLEERPSRGALITGYILTGVPYAIGLIAAVSSNFANSSAYLMVPWAGPWLTLGLRKNQCEATTDTSDDAADCLEEVGLSTGLVFDGIVQGAGGVVLLAAYLAPRQQLIRHGQAVSLNVTRVGTGYGVGASGSF